MSVHCCVVGPLHFMFYDRNTRTLSQLTHGFCAFRTSISRSVDRGNYICWKVRGMRRCKCNLFVSPTSSSVRDTAALHMLCFIKWQSCLLLTLPVVLRYCSRKKWNNTQNEWYRGREEQYCHSHSARIFMLWSANFSEQVTAAMNDNEPVFGAISDL
jgi:hypothetical protein